MAWSFKDALSASGKNPIRKWLNEQPPKARQKGEAILRHLAQTSSWGPPWVKPIAGVPGLFEIRWGSGGVPYRLLGGYGPGRAEFTLVLGAVEHNRRHRPPNAFVTAGQYLRAVEAGNVRVVDHEFEVPLT